MTGDDKRLIKSALRRAFTRSDLHKSIIDSTRTTNYFDNNRPRVKKWSICPFCEHFTPTYKVEIDHINPVIPYNETIDDVSALQLLLRIFTHKSNLQALCEDCHLGKTAAERDFRRILAGKIVKPLPLVGLEAIRKKSKRHTSKR